MGLAFLNHISRIFIGFMGNTNWHGVSINEMMSSSSSYEISDDGNDWAFSLSFLTFKHPLFLMSGIFLELCCRLPQWIVSSLCLVLGKIFLEGLVFLIIKHFLNLIDLSIQFLFVLKHSSAMEANEGIFLLDVKLEKLLKITR